MYLWLCFGMHKSFLFVELSRSNAGLNLTWRALNSIKHCTCLELENLSQLVK